jgi:hypothetical protein
VLFDPDFLTRVLIKQRCMGRACRRHQLRGSGGAGGVVASVRTPCRETDHLCRHVLSQIGFHQLHAGARRFGYRISMTVGRIYPW